MREGVRVTRTASELDTVFGVLADRTRRIVLAELIETPNNVASIDDLVERIREEQAARGEKQVLVEESVRVMLVHNHLPPLEAAGIIEFDDRSDTVRYYPHAFIEDLRQFINGNADYPIA